MPMKIGMEWAMKKYLYLAVIVCLCLISNPVMPCTGLMAIDGERVLVGNNEDWFNPRTKIWFIQPVNGRYGSVFFASIITGPRAA